MEWSIIYSDWSQTSRTDLSNIEDLVSLLLNFLENEENAELRGSLSLVLLYLIGLK